MSAQVERILAIAGIDGNDAANVIDYVEWHEGRSGEELAATSLATVECSGCGRVALKTCDSVVCTCAT